MEKKECFQGIDFHLAFMTVSMQEALDNWTE